MLTLPILRCIFRLDPTDPESSLRANLTTLHQEVDPDGIDKVLLQWIQSVAQRSGIVPDIALARAYFQDRAMQGEPDGPAALVRLDEVQRLGLAFMPEAEFRVALDAYQQKLMEEVTTQALIETANILKIGVTARQFVKGQGFQNVTIRGVEPALAHLTGKIATLHQRLRKSTGEGTFQGDMDQMIADYDRAVANPQTTVGVLSGLDAIDNVHHGIKRGELALVLGFTSHLKTTFCLNWFYKAAIYYGKHVAMASLETKIEVLRDLLAALHSTHQKFNLDPNKYRITYDRIHGGLLTSDEYEALKAIRDDLSTNPRYGKMFYKQPQARMDMETISRWAEGLQQTLQDPLELLVIDYLALVDAERGAESQGPFHNLNRSIRLSKLMAMEFNRGHGLGILSPYNSNREGYKNAQKAGGRYDLTALYGAPEAEKSSDFVYYTYLDDALRASCEVAVGNLKARNNPLIIEQWRCYADPATRLIDNLDLADPTQSKVQGGIV